MQHFLNSSNSYGELMMWIVRKFKLLQIKKPGKIFYNTGKILLRPKQYYIVPPLQRYFCIYSK